MKINIKATEKIRHALATANGAASTHTEVAATVSNAADLAEIKLGKLGIPKGQRAGAIFSVVTGGTVPNAYKYTRAVTQFKLERGATGWFLTDAGRTLLFPNQKGFHVMHITQAQRAIAWEKFNEQFVTIKPLLVT